MFPTWKEYRSQVPSTGQGLRSGVNAGMPGVLPCGIHPLAEPPLARLVRAAGVVVAHDVVEVLPGMQGRRAVLAHHLFTLLVIRRRLRTRQVPDVEHDVPLEGGTALGAAVFGLQDRLRKAAAMAAGQIRAHVRVPACPQPEGPHTSLPEHESSQLIADDSVLIQREEGRLSGGAATADQPLLLLARSLRGPPGRAARVRTHRGGPAAGRRRATRCSRRFQVRRDSTRRKAAMPPASARASAVRVRTAPPRRPSGPSRAPPAPSPDRRGGGHMLIRSTTPVLAGTLYHTWVPKPWMPPP